MSTIDVFVDEQKKAGIKSNRLINEKSPYLLQHAFNPVDWFPWGEEAFDKARSENKPIFLSIGYSTCHWCHVMEHESFVNKEIARLLNDHFVSIKVDREERPDVDRIYMRFTQRMTGGGGWPMTVFLTPDLKPFYAGTYFPLDTMYGRPGFKEVLTRIHELWHEKKQDILRSADEITAQITAEEKPDLRQKVADTVFKKTFQAFADSFDEKQGGFGSAPKFPRPAALNYILHYHRIYRDEKAFHMVLTTLRKMAGGGIRAAF